MHATLAVDTMYLYLRAAASRQNRILLRPRMRRIQAYLRKNSISASLVTIESVRASPILFGEERLSPSIEKARRSWSFNCDRITRKNLGVMKS